MPYPVVYRATVVNSVDPMNMGRVQVTVPSVAGAAAQWAMPCWPALVNDSHSRQPGPGDQIWVAFEAGDAASPVWLGYMR
jgi:hypothetical protein